MKKQQLAVAGAALLAALTGMAVEGDAGMGKGKGGKQKGSCTGIGSQTAAPCRLQTALPGMALRNLEALSLSEDQKTRINAVLESYRTEATTLAENLRSEHQALRDLVQAALPDEQAIRDQAAEAGRVEGDIAVLRSRVFQEIRGILTEAQLSTFFALQAQQDAFAVQLPVPAGGYLVE